jgi:hypothetical protein
MNAVSIILLFNGLALIQKPCFMELLKQIPKANPIFLFPSRQNYNIYIYNIYIVQMVDVLKFCL